MERFNLKKLSEAEGKAKYQAKILNRFTALGSLDDDVDMKRAWESIRGNIKISAKENLGSICKGSRKEVKNNYTKATSQNAMVTGS
jgi:hypothetical protein